MFGTTPYLNQTMMSGPSATFGIMLSADEHRHHQRLERLRPGEGEREQHADDERER